MHFNFNINSDLILNYVSHINMVYSDFKLIRMRTIPENRQTIRVNEIFSVRPNKAIPVVMISTVGPTSASNVLM